MQRILTIGSSEIVIAAITGGCAVLASILPTIFNLIREYLKKPDKRDRKDPNNTDQSTPKGE